MSRPMPTSDHAGLAAVRMLEQVAADLAGTESEHGRWVAGRIKAYLASPSRTSLDQAFGLTADTGKRPWWTVQTDAQRDRLIRELAATLPATNRTQLVTELQRRLRDYRAIAWVRDRDSKQPTAKNRILFEIFSLDHNPPTGETRLRQILED